MLRLDDEFESTHLTEGTVAHSGVWSRAGDKGQLPGRRSVANFRDSFGGGDHVIDTVVDVEDEVAGGHRVRRVHRAVDLERYLLLGDVSVDANDVAT